MVTKYHCYDFFFNWLDGEKNCSGPIQNFKSFENIGFYKYFSITEKKWLFIEKVIIIVKKVCTWKLFFLNLTTTPIYWNPPFLHPCSFTVRRVIAKSFKFIIVSKTFFQSNLLNNLLIIIKYFSIYNLINYITFFNQIFSIVENLFEIFVVADWHQ